MLNFPKNKNASWNPGHPLKHKVGRHVPVWAHTWTHTHAHKNTSATAKRFRRKEGGRASRDTASIPFWVSKPIFSFKSSTAQKSVSSSDTDLLGSAVSNVKGDTTTVTNSGENYSLAEHKLKQRTREGSYSSLWDCLFQTRKVLGLLKKNVDYLVLGILREDFLGHSGLGLGRKG